MFFKKDDTHLAKRGLKKIDALITGMILGGVIASIYGIKKQSEKLETKEGKRYTWKEIIKMLILGPPKK